MTYHAEASRTPSDKATPSGRVSANEHGALRQVLLRGQDVSTQSAETRVGKDVHGNPKASIDLYDVVEEIRRLRESTELMGQQIARLASRTARPDRIKYSIPEARKRMNRSRSSIYELEKAGELSFVREKGRVYITEEEIQRWERDNRR